MSEETVQKQAGCDLLGAQVHPGAVGTDECCPEGLGAVDADTQQNFPASSVAPFLDELKMYEPPRGITPAIGIPAIVVGGPEDHQQGPSKEGQGSRGAGDVKAPEIAMSWGLIRQAHRPVYGLEAIYDDGDRPREAPQKVSCWKKLFCCVQNTEEEGE